MSLAYGNTEGLIKHMGYHTTEDTRATVLGESVHQEVSRGFSWIFSSSEI